MGIKRYLKLYGTFLRFSFLRSTAYRVSFFVEILVEIGYSTIFIAFFVVMYRNIREVAGWSYYEALFLSGLNIVVSELVLGAVAIFNLHDLPEKIRNGDIDFTLIKPINSLFSITLGSPYTTSFLSAIPGFYLIWYSYQHLMVRLSVLNIAAAVVILLAGIIIAYSFMVAISSLAFKFINSASLPKIADEIFFYKSNPHTVYQGVLKTVFFYIFPVVFISSVPARTFLSGVDNGNLFSAIFLAVVFFAGTVRIWDHMLKHYSSASS